MIAIAGLGLVPFAISQLQIFTFYAMPDTKTPALVNVPVVILRSAVDILLYLVLPAGLVAAGLMGGNAISYAFSLAIGYWLLRRRLGRLGLRRILDTLARLSVAALGAAVPAGLIVLVLHQLAGDGKLASLLQLVVGGAALLAAFLAGALMLQVREVRELGGMLRRRLGR